ncbi:hypothetical protein NE237_010701 [Protea cynaroides]|uniref:Uncharacterized protein n=1 Tax=Protea cynaroides TaxID=273540 RepID=A0A9Q0L0Q8_9MAGN|nr:hypothetical protein NE237_010701 [Protea cynaroides]
MAAFPPNLDDGELWLPSDIFPDEVSAKINPEFPSELTYMEDLAQQLAGYALLEKRNQNTAKPPSNLVPNFFESKQQSRYGTVVSPRTGFDFGFSFGGVHDVGHRQNHDASVNEGFRVGLTQVCRYHPRSPAQSQVGSFLQARENGRSRVGFVREYGGTGVFLPRVGTTLDFKKKPGVKRGEEAKQRQPIKKTVVEIHDRFQASPDLGLPQDWTY